MFNFPTLRFSALSILFVLFSCLATIALAQNPGVNTPPPLPVRQISGIIKDTLDNPVVGATVSLLSATDTVQTSTNNDGIFIFKNIKSATYTLTVKSIGFEPTPAMRFLQNDAVARITMNPIIIKEQVTMLNEVKIDGTPSIVYKTDTVEYKASDYIVRENATVDELLKKMEGMEVGTDGTLTHQGNSVSRAKVNGKEYLGGDIAGAIQNLPAEIVDRIQIVDDYGDQAARTGVKDGDPEKVLNIVTRRDKSVGNTVRLNAGAGNNERYELSAFATRLNDNQTIGINARLSNTVNGIAGNDGNFQSGGGQGGGRQGGGQMGGQGGGGRQGGGGQGFGSGQGVSGNASSSGSGGITTASNNSFSYRDELSSRVNINMNYGYNYNNTNSLNSSESQLFSAEGTTFASNNSNSNSVSNTHNFSFEYEFNIDSSNFLRVTPRLSYASNDRTTESAVFQQGVINQDQLGGNKAFNKRPNLEGTIFYQHIFNKPRRNLSIQLSASGSDQRADQERQSNIIYRDSLTQEIIKDSLIHRMVERDNLTRNYRSSLTYVEPINTNSQLEFNGQVSYNGYDNNANTSNLNSIGQKRVIDSLSNIYEYSFTQARIALNYRYGVSNTSKIRASVGITAVPAILSGTKVSLNTTTRRTSLNVIPIARLQYLWSRQHSIQLNYSGNANEPTFNQIQPVRDVSNPQNPIIGNPDLKASFNHSINTSYNNYIANSRLNYSINFNTTFIQNSVVANSILVDDEYGKITETRFTNMNGIYTLNGNYSINKQLSDRKYNLSFSGNVGHRHGVSMSNNLKNITSTWTFTERFGPRTNPTEWLELNANIGYTVTRSENTLPSSINNKTNTLSLNTDGRIYFLQTFEFGYNVSKKYVEGIAANVTINPLVINSYIQKELFKRKATLTLQAFDILNQNNFINRNIDDNGNITDVKSNALSRYFMLRLSMRLQKWTGAQPRNGREMMRRGDGSFIR